LVYKSQSKEYVITDTLLNKSVTLEGIESDGHPAIRAWLEDTYIGKTLHGGAGEDEFIGGAVSDELYGNAGDDYLHGNAGNDLLDGGAGDDYLHGGSGNDSLDGGTGNDALNAGSGRDVLTGGIGADNFVVGSGEDIVMDFKASEGDTLEFSFDVSDAAIVTGPAFTTITHGSDSVTIHGQDHQWYVAPEPEPVEEETPTEVTPEPAPESEEPTEVAGETPAETPEVPAYTPVARIPGENYLKGETLNSVFHRIQADNSRREWIGDTHQAPEGEPGNFRDHMIADSGGSTLRSKKGRDYLEGANGNDFLSGGNARDWLVGGRGGDRLQGGRQDDVLTGGTGRDIFVFRADHGRDIVTDFAVGKDTLALEGVEFSDLTIKKWAKGTGARVEWDEGTIYLEGVQKDALTEDSFEFIA